MIYIASVLASAYLILQLYYVWYWLKTPETVVPAEFIPSHKITVVVIAHNEEACIESCIRGILNQHYPPEFFEIIVIDDRSSDGTVEQIKKLKSPFVRIYHLTDYPECIHAPAYKKSAIELVVKMASHPWIVVTDADCIPAENWLKNIAYTQVATNAVFLAAPISFSPGKTMIEKMQSMEMSVLMLITAAGIKSRIHDMANGANMSFSKQAFIDVKGYEGNYAYASGDDMFLIEKMRFAFPEGIAFVKSRDAIVETKAHTDWRSLIKQRLRWAGKNKGLQSSVIRMIWIFVGFFHLWIGVTLALVLFQFVSWWPFIISILIKWIADVIVLHHASKFMKVKVKIFEFIPIQFIYGYYTFRLGCNILLRKKGDW